MVVGGGGTENHADNKLIIWASMLDPRERRQLEERRKTEERRGAGVALKMIVGAFRDNGGHQRRLGVGVWGCSSSLE